VQGVDYVAGVETREPRALELDRVARRAVDQLEGWHAGIVTAQSAAPADRALHRVASLVTVGHLIARAALRREESRGGHFRADFPRRDDLHWQVHLVDQYHG